MELNDLIKECREMNHLFGPPYIDDIVEKLESFAALRARVAELEAERDEYKRLRDVAADVGKSYEMGWRKYLAALRYAYGRCGCSICPLDQETCGHTESGDPFLACFPAMAKEHARLGDFPSIPDDASVAELEKKCERHRKATKRLSDCRARILGALGLDEKATKEEVLGAITGTRDVLLRITEAAQQVYEHHLNPRGTRQGATLSTLQGPLKAARSALESED